MYPLPTNTYYAKVFDLHPDRQAAANNQSSSSSSSSSSKSANANAKTTSKESAEFIRTVKAWEILSDSKKRRQYDLDASSGNASRYAHEAEGRSGASYSTDTSWNPRYGRGWGSASQSAYYGAEWPGHDRDYYYGPMNTGPLYMANWKMGLLVVGVAMMAGTVLLGLFDARRRAYVSWTDRRETEAKDFYEERRRRAKELGYDKATESLRAKAKQVEAAAELDAAAAAAAGQNSNAAGDATAIDLNCGCPKRFSLVSAMGAALLQDPDRLCAILTALVENVPLQITCKIRMLETVEKTIELAQRIERTGVAALALHGRLATERPRDPAHWDIFEPVARAIKIPLIANGDIWDVADMEKLRASQSASFMLARAPQANFTCFRPDGKRLPIDECMRMYVKKAIEMDMAFHNCKYTILQMWPTSLGEYKTAMGGTEVENPVLGMEVGSKAKNYRDLCSYLGITEYYEAIVRKRVEKATQMGRLDLLSKDIEGILGPDCPYIPDDRNRWIPKNVKDKNVEEVDIGSLSLF
ncbi:tRNA-dihydrouridine(20) synthase [NAD(P)+]-like [Chytridiales sp. JEL 0842]|nr:tRNA-dihydrouridine(20) synthase [NAD(P)+]-like [Chytridiales sp. JEL 0842]